MYYSIDEETARTAHNMVHMSEYAPGTATAVYRASVDAVAKLVEERKQNTSPFYHEKLDRLFDSYCKRYADWTNAYNRNAAKYPSQLISGAGNYNMSRHNKQMAREGELWKEHDEITSILDKIKSIGTGPVDLADPDAHQILEDQLQQTQSELDRNKAINAHFRKHKTFAGFPGISDETAVKLDAEFKDLQQRCPYITKPSPDYELTSLRNKIKRLQARIEELNKRIEKPAESTSLNGVEIIRNTEVDRLQIVFDSKPDEEMRNRLKSNGFRWSPRFNAWQRQLTQNAEYAARRVLSEVGANA